MPRRRLLPLLAFAAATLACKAIDRPIDTRPPPSLDPTPLSIPARDNTQAILDRMGASTCPDSDFTCVSLTVPLDHFNSADARTMDVVFAVLPATGERKGMFVTVVGGPGGSGLAVADGYTAAFDRSILESFDVVFFDQRGVGASGGLQCVESAAAFYQTEAEPTTPAGEAALAEGAERFTRECTAEMGNPELLPYLGTEQAIEDLEVFRAQLGEDRFWLYGESYGTQFAQTYGAKYAQHLAGMILDGPVDLQATGLEFSVEQATAFADVLAMTLRACAEDEFCAADIGGDPFDAYDRLAARLAQSSLPFDFPLPSGTPARREFTLGSLETAAAVYAYSETGRMIFLRGLAAATSREDLIPMARILYDSLSLDPENLAPIPDPGWSDAVYYAVECNDYDYASAKVYLRAGDEVDARLPRLGSVFYGDLPCTFWPEDGFDPGRPEPLVADGVPTLVMVGTADPATPIDNARRIIRHLADGYLVIEQGGPHVIFGWGNPCVDDLVTDFLVRGVPPARETACDGVVIDEYIPLAPKDAADFANPLEALASVDTEIYYLPEYMSWDGETSTRVGCPYGGTLSLEPSSVGETLTFSACAFSRGFALSGGGEIDYGKGSLRLQVSVTGSHTGSLVYLREGNGDTRVTGEYAGASIDLSE